MAATSRTVGGCREGPARSIGLMREVPTASARYRPIDLSSPPRWPPPGPRSVASMDRIADGLTTASGGENPHFLPKIPLRTVLLYYKGL